MEAGTLMALFTLLLLVIPILLIVTSAIRQEKDEEGANQPVRDLGDRNDPTDEGEPNVSPSPETNETKDPEVTSPVENQQWRCVCEAGFLPPGLLGQTLGGAEAVLRMSTGQCYHKTQ